MREIRTLILISFAILSVRLFAEVDTPSPSHAQPRGRDAGKADSWTKTMNNRAKRGMLHDCFHKVRGDTGRWNDKARLQHAPTIQQKPDNVLLDEWSDQLLDKKLLLTGNDDNGLLFRTRQLDDNDRVWVERIERRANQFIVVAHQAIWQGRYSKNFTYFSIIGVNLGKLEPGKYEAKCIIEPLVFDKFEEPSATADNWPKNERSADEKPMELPITFTVVENPR